MKELSNQFTAGRALVLLGLCLALTPGLQAADSDLSTTTSVPGAIAAGQPFTVTVGYANAGPDTAGSAYPNHYFVPPMGLDVFVDNAVNGDGSMYTALQESADGTDTLGNAPLLFFDDNYCEEVLFQVQRADDDTDANPVEGLTPGASSTFTYQTTIPMEDFASSTVTITEPASLAQSWHGNITSVLDAAAKNAFSRGACEKNVGGDDEEMCSYIFDNCFGARVSQLDAPFEAEFELVNDGSADPTLGCEEFVGFTPGNIAVLRRGTCEFGAKTFNAEQAGALAVYMVNDGRCGDFAASDQCVLGMLAGDLGGLTTIPTIQVSQADGEEVITALEGGATVRGIYGDTTVFTAQTTIFLAEASDTDPDDTNDDSYQRGTVSAIPDPPVAAFTYTPQAPVAGAAVQFTDASTGGAPASWMWDFGDGATSTEQNPMHTFASGGTFTVSLAVENAGGASDTSMDVVVTPGAELTEATFIPAAALAAGAEGSFFQTDVDVNNAGQTDASFAFLWLPRGENNSEPAQSSTYQLAAGASQRFENVLAEVFGAEPNVAGALAVLSNSTDMKVMSRTYDVSQADTVGTFGQALPGVPAADLIGQNDTRRIIFMSENDALRANLGCVNGVNDNVPIDITIYDAAGTMLETQRLALGPWSNNQINQIFADYAPTNGYADVTSIKANAGFFCYGSVLDNNSNDPTTILPTEYGMDGTTYFIPAAALSAGAEGSFFQTDVDLNNGGAEMVTYQFLWLPRGANNSEPATSDSFTLAAGASVRYENVLAEVFGAEPDVAGALAITSDSTMLGVMSRTYDVSQAATLGTFGQAIPGIPADNLIGQNDTRRIIFMSQNEALRANLGCVNGVNDNVPIDITTYDAAGNELETQRLALGPWSNNQINLIFADFAPTNGYADVSSIKANAGFFCYGSVLDNNSNDPTTILPQ
ncbi:MAG: PKD domain-containing protein [Candidatus Sulfomarinibacteraceae bacterium]